MRLEVEGLWWNGGHYCGSTVVPRHSLIGWMTMLSKLPTMAKMMQWEISGDSLCNFYRASIDDMDRPFFKCPFTKRVTLVDYCMYLSSMETNECHCCVHNSTTHLSH